MTRDDILRMAREAGMDRKPADHNCRVDYFDVVTDSELERFAALVAAAEREECAKVCEVISDEYHRREGFKYPEMKTDAETGASDCETAIRARERNERHSNNEV